MICQSCRKETYIIYVYGGPDRAIRICDECEDKLRCGGELVISPPLIVGEARPLLPGVWGWIMDYSISDALEELKGGE